MKYSNIGIKLIDHRIDTHKLLVNNFSLLDWIVVEGECIEYRFNNVNALKLRKECRHNSSDVFKALLSGKYIIPRKQYPFPKNEK